jgi:type I restriction enzyme, S subunit
VWACIEELAADDNRAIQSGPFGSNLLHSEFRETGYLVIGIDNVQDGIFSLGSQNRIGKTKFFELECFRTRPHDVLVTAMATVGDVRFTRSSRACNNNETRVQSERR